MRDAVLFLALCASPPQVSGPVKGRMTDMLEQHYKGFDVWGSGESTFFNYIMIDVSNDVTVICDVMGVT